ncbi:MAG: glutamine-hydrolyzing carbamoyl-phosphate synthase small subunit [Erysipelotrichaceae bacterium]|nr:glutamine-hydrolyzing carbamoyl-phosphate synthase small subunit [Erysipelotrichaceae bacterium]
MKRKLVLQNGMEFIGHGFGSFKETIAELVFNTSVVGYQEILSDPTYYGQMLCMTYTLIGNYGMIDEDYDSKVIGPKALVVREYNDKPSNFRYTKTLNEVLEENDVVGITHVDTRQLTRVLREQGSMLGIICDLDVTTEEALAKINDYIAIEHPVSQVSCQKVWYSRCPNPKYNVVTVDCGAAYNMIREWNHLGCNVTIVPYNTSYEKIMGMNPDGVVISMGPGSPENCKEVIELIQKIQGQKPILGFGLGCQLIALANGLSVEKLVHGHRGSSYPVRNTKTNKVEITSQNHSYVISSGSDNVQVTYENVMDHTIEGIEVVDQKCFGVQFYPTNTLGVSHECYQQFIEYMQKGGN